MVVRTPSTTTGQLITVLPRGFRPSMSVSFPTMALTGDDTVYRVDVNPNGQVTLGNSAAQAINIGLDNIDFAVDTATQFRAIALSGDFVPHNSAGWEIPTLAVSTAGRVFLRGLARRKSGNVVNGDLVFTLPEGLRPLKKVRRVRFLDLRSGK